MTTDSNRSLLGETLGVRMVQLASLLFLAFQIVALFLMYSGINIGHSLIGRLLMLWAWMFQVAIFYQPIVGLVLTVTALLCSALLMVSANARSQILMLLVLCVAFGWLFEVWLIQFGIDAFNHRSMPGDEIAVLGLGVAGLGFWLVALVFMWKRVRLSAATGLHAK